MSQSMREAVKKPMKAVGKKVEKSGKSGKYDIFSIPALEKVEADNRRMEVARLTDDPDSVGDIAKTLPPGMVDFEALFDAGFRRKIGGSCDKITDSITVIQKKYKEQDSDEDPKTLFILAEPKSIIALAGFGVTIIAAKSTWSEITANPRYMVQQQKAFGKIAEICIDDCYKNVDTKAQVAIKVLRDCMAVVEIAGIDTPQANGKIAEANKALELLNDEIGSQVSQCGKKIEQKCADSLSAVITAEIKQSKEILATRGKKVASIGADVTLIVGHAAHGVGSMGATGGLALAGIIRAAVDMGQTIKDCALDLDMLGKEIDANLWAVKKVYSDDKKVGQMLKEGAIATIQAATCLDLPSITTCCKKIEEYKYKIVLLESSGNMVRRQERAVKQTIADYRHLYKQQQSDGALSAGDKAAWDSMLASAETAHFCLIDIGDNKDKRITIAENNVVMWNQTLSKFDVKAKQVGEIVGTATSLAIGTGSSVGGIGAEAIDGTLNGLEGAYSLIVETGSGVVETIKEFLKE